MMKDGISMGEFYWSVGVSLTRATIALQNGLVVYQFFLMYLAKDGRFLSSQLPRLGAFTRRSAIYLPNASGCFSAILWVSQIGWRL